MGLPMAKNCLAAGHRVQAFDLSEQAMKDAEQAGAVLASKPGHVAKDVSPMNTG